MAITEQDYFLKQGETQEAYHARIADLRAQQASEQTQDTPEEPTITEPTVPEPEVVSSEDIEQELDEAKKQLEQAGVVEEKALETKFEREKRLAEEAGLEKKTTALELSRGLGAATSFALADRIDKAMKRDILELEESKNIALASGDVKRAEALANLSFKALEFKYKAQQDALDNALKAQKMQLDIIQEQRLQRQPSQDLAAKYPDAGILSTDSFDEAIKKAGQSPSFKAAVTTKQLTEENKALAAQLALIKLKEETGVTPGQIISASTGLPVKLTAEQGLRYGQFAVFQNYTLPKANELSQRGDVILGGITGRALKIAENTPLFQHLVGEDQIALNQVVAQSQNLFLYLTSGKQINEAEFKRLKDTMPRMEDTSAQFKVHLKGFSDMVNTQFGGELRALGWKVAGGDIVQQIGTTQPEEVGTSKANNILQKWGIE